MSGLDKRVLGSLCGIPIYQVSSRIITPLGKELGAAQSRGHVLTRHKLVADAIVVAASRVGCDLAETWASLVRTTVRLGRKEKFDREFFNYIVHSGTKLMGSLPKTLDADLRGEIGIAAAEADVAAEINRLTPIVDLARAFRFADYPKAAYDLLRKRATDLANAVDKAQNMRGYYYEWATCSGNLGDRQGSIGDAWLAAYSISDSLPVEVTSENAKMACAGLGEAFGKLIDNNASDVYALGRRAATELGWHTKLDARAVGILTRHQRESDSLGTPKPIDNDEAFAWLAAAALAAWKELEDPIPRQLRGNGHLTFQRLQKTLATIPVTKRRNHRR